MDASNASAGLAPADNPAASLEDRRGASWRWWGATAGLLTGLFDAVLMAAMGVSFEINGRNVTLLVGGYFGLSFAVLGFLLGAVAAGRRRDQRAAGVIRAQLEAIDEARRRLAQSEKLAALGQLAAAIAHEVRTPLAIMRSAAQGIAEGTAEGLPDHPDDVRRACSFITAEIDRLTNVVTSLLAFARPPQLHPRPIAVRDLFEHAAQLAGKEMAAKRVSFQRHPDGALPEVRVDADLMCQVLLGLMANAVEAVGPGAEVCLEAQARSDAVEIAVTDNGPGVPPQLRNRIFEPFFTTRAHGTGLGLAVARQIVEAHGGRIEVGDRPGGGACFTISLPVAASDALAA